MVLLGVGGKFHWQNQASCYTPIETTEENNSIMLHKVLIYSVKVFLIFGSFPYKSRHFDIYIYIFSIDFNRQIGKATPSC